jgi:hypothetical protein
MLLSAAAEASSPKEILIFHDTQVRQPAGTVALARGDVLNIRVSHTINWCYTYNLTNLPEPPAAVKESGRRAAFTEDVLIPVVHDGKAPGYRVSIKKRASLTADEKTRCFLPDADFDIPVETLSWNLGFAGGFTADRIPDPVYFLEPGKKKVNDVDTDGFFVKENRSAESRASLGTTAFIHLFHSDPDKYSILGGFANWAPVSFGLAVGSNSQTKYFLGTSLRFDQHLYLTGGVAIGPSTRLPNTLDLHDHNFTTSATALDNSPKRTAAGLFIGVSYTFLGRNLTSTFSGPFASPPAKGAVTPPVGGNDNDTNDNTVTPTIQKIDPSVGQKPGGQIVLSGTGFKPAVGAIKVQIATSTKNFDGVIQSGATDTTLTVKIPDDFPPGDALITVTAGEATSNQFKYTVTTK